MTTNATRPPAKADIQQHAYEDLRKTYLYVYGTGEANVGDIVDAVHVNSRYARELLGTLTQAKLLFLPDENDAGTWSYDTHPYDDKADAIDSAVEVFEEWAKSVNLAPAAPVTATKTVKAPQDRLPKSKGTGHCRCGCGASTKGNYAPGHDARHAGMVAKALAEYLISNQIDPSESINDHGHALLAPLPSGALKEKAWRIAVGLVAKASTKGRATNAVLSGQPEPVEARSPEDDATDTVHVHVHEVMDRVARELRDGDRIEKALDPTYVYGTVKVGRQTFLARRDADGVVMRTNTSFKGVPNLAAAEAFDYTGSVEGKPATTFKVLS